MDLLSQGCIPNNRSGIDYPDVIYYDLYDLIHAEDSGVDRGKALAIVSY